MLDGLRERADGSVELKCPGAVEAAVFAGGGEVDVEALARAWRRRRSGSGPPLGNFSRERYEALAARMARARVETVVAGHLAPMERPELVAEAILRFADEPAGAP